MTLRARLTVSVWAFVLLTPPEILFAVQFLQARGRSEPLGILFVVALAVLLPRLVVSWLLVWLWQIFIRPPSRARFRSTPWSLCVYTAITMVGTFIMISGIYRFGQAPPGAASMWILALIGEPATVIVLALIVDQVRDGWSTSRSLRVVLRERLIVAQQVNDLLEQAEDSVQRQSFEEIRDRVAGPLSRLARSAHGMSDERIVETIDRFIDGVLRPLSHSLHPVSVRLGLTSAVRSLGPDVSIDLPQALDRLDSDGDLLDDSVRLQVYRWIRDSYVVGSRTSVTAEIAQRSLVVSITPTQTCADLDAIQTVAGLRCPNPGVLTAPLKGQVPPTETVAREVSDAPTPVRMRIDWKAAFTTPLPRRFLMVSLMALGSIPIQIMATSGTVSFTSILASASWVATALLLTLLFTRIHQPRARFLGVVRVFGQWAVVGVAAGIALSLTLGYLERPGDALGNTLTDALRGMVRFTLPGLALVTAHGVSTRAHVALEEATIALAQEDARREEILARAHERDRYVAEALHRTVQGRLSAAMVLLQIGRREEALVEIHRMAEETLPVLLERIEPSPSSGQTLLIDRPPGLRVSEHVETPLDEALLVDVRRVVGEAAANAVRHGGATKLAIRLTREDDSLVLMCVDDGRGLPSEHSPGLGSRLLDEVCSRWRGRWSLTDNERGCTLQISLTDFR